MLCRGLGWAWYAGGGRATFGEDGLELLVLEEAVMLRLRGRAGRGGGDGGGGAVGGLG